MFGDTLSAAFKFTLGHKMVLVRVTAIPILVAVLLQLVSIEIQNPLFDWAVVFVEALISSIIAINVHRIVLNGENSVPKWGRFTLGKIELWFFGHYMVLWLGVFAIFYLTTLIGVIAGAFAIVAGILSCRLCLVFPAIALGKGVSFRYAWHHTAQKTWYMLCVVAIAPFLFGLLLVPIALISPLPAIFTVISYLVTVLAVITLSFAYKALIEEPEPSEQE